MTAELDRLVAQAHQKRHCADYRGAQVLYLQALSLAPGNLAIRLDAAAASLACDDLRQVLSVLSLVRAQDVPSELRWRFHLCSATALQRLSRPEAAVAHYSSAVVSPGIPEVSAASAVQSASDLLLNALGDPLAAAALYGTGHTAEDATADLVPVSLQSRPQAWLSLLVAAMYTGAVESQRLVSGFRAFADVHLQPVRTFAATGRPAEPAPLARGGPARRLRIGMVSPLFCASPVGFLTLGCCEALAARADLILFDRGGKADWAQARFRAAATTWVSCKSADTQALRHLFESSALDAVVDMGGWMDLDVLRALAYKPVRLQFKWVGGQSLTTGLGCFDAFWADERQIPSASRYLYAEPVAYLSEGYVTYTSAPYRDLASAAAAPPPPQRVSRGAYALVSNPAKIGPRMRARLDELKPSKLFLMDHRWRYPHARQTVQRWLGPWASCAEFIAPAHHMEYLDALTQLDAAVIDTEPYSMGLTAIELRLLGKHIMSSPRGAIGTMSERHCVAHLQAGRFDHYRLQAEEILAWCSK